MNIFASFRYQMADQKKTILIYYVAMIVFFLIFGVLLLLPLNRREGGVVTNGMSSVTAIFLFVVSLCSFKDNFGMSLQNGVTRRSLFLGRMCVTGTVCAVMAALDEVLTAATVLPGKLLGVRMDSHSLLETAYGPVLGDSFSPFLRVLCSFAFSFFLLLAASGAGYFITILFYRLNKVGKILVGAGAPCLFFFGVPLLKMLNEHIAGGKIGEAAVRMIAAAAQFCFGQPQNAMLTAFAVFVLLSALAWLLMRRAVVK